MLKLILGINTVWRLIVTTRWMSEPYLIGKKVGVKVEIRGGSKGGEKDGSKDGINDTK
ncbi:hypothetical protein ALTERO38_50319 [Alteromonas sp. 38]|nr:hypothetical protein ALTER154_80952 [Alteromonas sp. 154]VXB28549.1 hypothetical protein ALTERO38_50319 [Alteromonas sp. 38]